MPRATDDTDDDAQRESFPVHGEIGIVDEPGGYRVPVLDVQAGSLSIDGRPVAFDGKLYTSPDRVTVDPRANKNGLLRLEWDDTEGDR